MQPDLVSVIIPTYNRADCICSAIDSVLAQTHSNWEALVIDDGSTDCTEQLIADRYRQEPRIRYFYQSNAGVSNARNTGIAQANGRYIAFLDSDDTWKHWKLQLQIECLKDHPEVGMIWTDMEAVDTEGEILDPLHLKTMYSGYRHFTLDTLFQGSEPLKTIGSFRPDPDSRVYFGDIYAAMIMGSLVHTSTVLLRSERLGQVGGFDEELRSSGEDYDFHLRTCKYGPVALINVASIRYLKGRKDHLSHDSASTAVNFLTTLQRAIADDRATNRFPAKSVRNVLAEAHGWVAKEKFQKNDNNSARRHAIRSLRIRACQPRLVAIAALACIPSTARQSLLYGYRALKRRLRAS